MKNNQLNADIYNISDYINNIKKQFTDIPGETMFMSIFGYTTEVYSNMFQNAIVMASEYSNESIPYKAKFEKNIITHALSLGLTDINAVPSRMTALVGFLESDLLTRMKNDKFIFDKNNKFFIGDYEFHVDYDILITKNMINNQDFNFTARYIIDEKNILSNVSNPYLSPPIRMLVQNEKYVYIQCTIRQVEQRFIYKKILTDNVIENKTFTFDFDSQLASFTLDIVEGDQKIHLVPIYEGLMQTTLDKYCFYSYIDANTIRIKFDRDSYEPRINADVTIDLKMTSGSEGNFTFKDELMFTFDSTKYNYSSLPCTLKPVTDAEYGTDKKSITDLKKMIPKEAASRGSITKTSDLENFFNMLDTDTSKLYFYKKRDNQFERLYYSYILLKNRNNTIIPTNTISVALKESDLVNLNSSNLILKPGVIIKYSNSTGGEIVESVDKEENGVFYYTIPYMMIINIKPLYSSYYMTVIDKTKFLEFDYINEKCMLQFIATYCKWTREYKSNQYKLSIPFMQNIASDQGIVETSNGEVNSCNMKVVALLYNGTNVPYRYAIGSLSKYDNKGFVYQFDFTFDTNDDINEDNLIKIENLYDIGTTNKSYGYLNGNTKIDIYVLHNKMSDAGREYLDKYIPGLEGYSLSNKYKITNGIDFFYNYSDIISSSVSLTEDVTTDGVKYNIKSIPVVSNKYMESVDNVKEFINQLEQRKEYINYSLNILEDSFGIDFKFFNTYGPAQIFMINYDKNINRVNLSMKFRLKLVSSTDKYIKEYIIRDIKKYIENINELSDLHIPNLITQITNTYREQLVYFEFLDMNGYGPGYQHIYNKEKTEIGTVPEFLNINTTNGLPDIEIEMV